MITVYLIRSIVDPSRRYIGHTAHLQKRLFEHEMGLCRSTRAHRPWELVAAILLRSRDFAVAFEKYLKSGSGRAFANRRLWL